MVTIMNAIQNSLINLHIMLISSRIIITMTMSMMTMINCKEIEFHMGKVKEEVEDREEEDIIIIMIEMAREEVVIEKTDNLGEVEEGEEEVEMIMITEGKQNKNYNFNGFII